MFNDRNVEINNGNICLLRAFFMLYFCIKLMIIYNISRQVIHTNLIITIKYTLKITYFYIKI